MRRRVFFATGLLTDLCFLCLFMMCSSMCSISLMSEFLFIILKAVQAYGNWLMKYLTWRLKRFWGMHSDRWCCCLLTLVLVLTLSVPDFLREDTPVGTSFLRAAAHDDDQGTNAAIMYSLTHQTPAYFHINPSTGWVYVSHPISQVRCNLHSPCFTFLTVI